MGRFAAAVVIGAAMMTVGCASQTGAPGRGVLPDLLDVGSWSWSEPPSDTNFDDSPGEPFVAEVQRPDPVPPLNELIERSEVSPRTVETAPILGSLPPVVDRHYERQPDQANTKTKASATSHDDIWSRIRAGMRLPLGQKQHLRSSIRWIGSHERYFRRVTQRGQPYLHHIIEAVEKRAMPSEIALLPIIESGFKPFAYSRSSAAGLWQIIPTTGKQLGLRYSWWYDGRRDIVDGTEAALDYLQLVNNNLGGDWLLSIAAYNCGEGAVRRARAKSVAKGRGTDFWSIRPFLPRETQNYVPRLLAVAAAVRAPDQYGLSLFEIPNEPYFTVVPLHGQLDLGVAAKSAGIKLKQMQRLNPGFKRWATDPDGPHRLLLPRNNVELFAAAVAKLPASERITWRRHQVRRGESLSVIARRYGTQTDVLRKVNRLSSNSIRTGADLLVPQSANDAKDYAIALPPNARETKPRPSRKSRPAKANFTKNYTIRRGDTLWAIAKRSGTTTRQLARANGLNKHSKLMVGQQLRIPGRPRRQAATSTSSGTVRHYTVRSGDSLWVIAKREGIPLADLRTWNRIKSDKLKVGQILKLYPPHKS